LLPYFQEKGLAAPKPTVESISSSGENISKKIHNWKDVEVVGELKSSN
jgi:hypothetical protein